MTDLDSLRAMPLEDMTKADKLALLNADPSAYFEKTPRPRAPYLNRKAN